MGNQWTKFEVLALAIPEIFRGTKILKLL